MTQPTNKRLLTEAAGNAALVDRTLGGQGADTFHLILVGSQAGGMGTGSTDTTPKMHFQSWQTPHDTGSIGGMPGRTVINDVMHPLAKALNVWRMPSNPAKPFDAITNKLRDVTWVGAHWNHYQDGAAAGVHAHWSIEVPDATGALQTRFEIKIADDAQTGDTAVVGLDKTFIITNLADFVVRSSATQFLRIAGDDAGPRMIEFSKGIKGSDKRWRAGVREGSGNFEFVRYLDGDVNAGRAFAIQRSDGRIAAGQITDASIYSTNSMFVLRYSTPGQNGFRVVPTVSMGTGSAYFGELAAATDRLLGSQVAGEAVGRFVAFADGKHEWSDGTGSRDTNLYRAAADTLGTDDDFEIMSNTKGVILKSTNGTRYRITVSNTGTLAAVAA